MFLLEIIFFHNSRVRKWDTKGRMKSVNDKISTFNFLMGASNHRKGFSSVKQPPVLSPSRGAGWAGAVCLETTP